MSQWRKGTDVFFVVGGIMFALFADFFFHFSTPIGYIFTLYSQ